jgi:hypothetical protein
MGGRPHARARPAPWAIGDVPNVHTMRVIDGKITELREYMGDERREDQFWGSRKRG